MQNLRQPFVQCQSIREDRDGADLEATGASVAAGAQAAKALKPAK